MLQSKNITATTIIIIASGLILRIVALNDPITYDEAYTYIAFASHSVWAAVSDYSLPNNHIFHSVLVFFSTSLFGNALWALRLPAFLAGVGMILAAYAFGKTAYNEETGLVGATLVAYMPAVITYTTDARGYSLVGLFTLIVFWLSARLAGQQPAARDWAFLAIATALGLWTIPIMLYPSGAAYLWLAISIISSPSPTGKWKMMKAWLFSGLGAGALTLALYVPALRVSGWHTIFANNFVQPMPLDGYFTSLIWIRISDTWQTWMKAAPAFMPWILTIGVILSLAFHRQIQPGRVSLSLTMLAWVTLYVILRRPSAFDRFWSWMLAPFLVWAAAGLCFGASQLTAWAGTLGAPKAGLTARQPQSGKIRAEQILVLASLIFILVSTGAAIPSIPTRWKKQSNHQAMAIALHDVLRPGDRILVTAPVDAPLWYYLERAGVPETYWRPRNDFSRAFVVRAASQSIEKVIRQNRLSPEVFDLQNAHELGRIGQIFVYECVPKR